MCMRSARADEELVGGGTLYSMAVYHHMAEDSRTKKIRKRFVELTKCLQLVEVEVAENLP